MSRAATAGSTAIPSDDASHAGYFTRSELPLTSLLFLLPLIVLYEVGTHFHWTDAPHGESQQIVAFILMRRFFSLFGAGGRHLPALAIVGILLAWHIARNDRWRLHPPTLLLMAAESFLLCLPLIALGSFIYIIPHTAWNSFRVPEPGSVILRLGAGVYEELIFRLILFTLLSLLLRDVFRFPKRTAYLLLVVGSAILFAAYHYLGSETFVFRTFAFRTLAGLYFGVMFLFRGFGITAGSHAAYDLVILLLYMPAASR